ncbi:uncharacterized protein LOC123520456 [Portunus trituberculatus]|uniref:uncharacterized protein LOC123520456 n=1 Tax=Portunus trituberculatus TaxID=210409 RepID=UPI001E1CE404|nr:uncharacterized protein LOC123520456 [Portunus trituberculatus]
MKGTLATVTLAVVVAACSAGNFHDTRCPRNFNLAAATFPIGQSPKACFTTQDCPFGQLCCPALSSATDLCLFPSSGNGPFPGSSLSGNRPINSHIPHSNGQNPIVNGHIPLVNGHNPHVNGQCPANFRLAAATFPFGQSPSRCRINKDCPQGTLCCPVIDSVSNLCLSPASGFPGNHISNSKPIVFPGQVASNIQGRCPSQALNLAVVRLPAGQPIYCGTTSDCPRRQLCCPAVNPASKVCRDVFHH